MPRKSIRYGFKIALRSEKDKGFVLATNNVLLPLGVLPEGSENLRFENAVFQIVTGDGEPTAEVTQRRIGEEIKFGQTIRLIHVTSNTFVCESKRSRATKEKANQKVILAAVNSEEARHSKWRIMPRYKVRSEGEKVCDKDIIVLQSGDVSLHIAAQCDSSTDFFYEVNASNMPTGLTLQAYDTESYDPNSETREIRGGDCLQLFHREERANLIGDKLGKCVLEPEQIMSGDRMVKPGDLLNSNSMFVIEFDDLFAGGLVTFGRKRTYRLKSLANGHYLCCRPRKEANEGNISPGGKPPFGSNDSASTEDPNIATSFAINSEETLGIDASVEVVLVEDHNEPGTCLCFHQATDDPSTNAKNRSRVFLEFPRIHDGVWLVAGEVDVLPVRRKSSMSARGEMDFSRPKKKVACSSSVSHKDGIEIMRVPTAEFQDLNSVLALVPPIERLIEQMNKGSLPSVQLVAQVKENMVLLAKLCTSSGEEDILIREGNPVYKVQNRLLDQMIPQTCLRVIESVFNERSPITTTNISDLMVIPDPSQSEDKQAQPGAIALKYSDFLLLVRVAFRMIRQCSMRNSRVAAALSDEIEVIFKYTQYPFGAIDTLREIFRDNPRLVDNPDDMKIVEQFTDLVQTSQRTSPVYMHFMPLLCICRGVGMKAAQTHIMEELFTQPSRKCVSESDLFFSLWLDPATQRVRINSQPVPQASLRASTRSPQSPQAAGSPFHDSGNGMDFVEFCLEAEQRLVSSRSSIASLSMKSSAPGASGPPSTPYGFFEAQMEIFVALCRGRHSINIEACMGYVPAECIVPIISNESLPSSIRALFFQYFEVAVVDVPPLEDMVEAARSLVKVWDKIGTDADVLLSNQLESLPSTTVAVIDEMKKFLLGFLKDNSSMDPGDDAQNICVSSAVECSRCLAQFGLIKHDEFVDWIKALAPVLDGRDDKTPAFDERYHRRFGKYSRYRYDEDNHLMMECKLHVMKTLGIFVDMVKAQRVSELLRVFKNKSAELPHMCSILDFNPKSELDKASEKLAEDKKEFLEKANANLLGDAFNTLTDGLGSGLDAMKGLGNAVISVIPGVSNEKEDPVAYLNELIEILLDNTQYEYEPVVVDAANLGVDILNLHHGLVAPLSRVQILSSASGVTYFEMVHPTFREFSRYVGLTIPRTEMTYITNKISELCDSLQSDASAVPRTNQINSERQAILKNMGLHIVIANITQSFTQSESSTFPPVVTALLAECYHFLCLMIWGSQETALDIFHFLEDFTKHLVLRVGADNLMLAMFKNNVDLCNSVTDKIMQDLVYAIPRVQYDPVIAHIIHLLVHQSGVVGSVPRNQQNILKLLMEAEESIVGVIRCRDLYTGTQGRRAREEAFETEEHLRPGSRIMFHLEILSVVIHCVKGRDASKKMDLRQAMFGSQTSVDDVLEVIVNKKKVPVFFRAVYVKLFTDLYVEDRTLRSAILEHKYFQKFLMMLHDELMAFDQDLSDLSEPGAWGGDEQPPFATAASLATDERDNIAGEDDEASTKPPLFRQLNSKEVFLNYVLEAVIPCIKSIITNLFSGHEPGNEDDGSISFASTHNDNDHTVELKEKLRDLAELVAPSFNTLVNVHPFAEKIDEEEPLPGTVNDDGTVNGAPEDNRSKSQGATRQPAEEKKKKGLFDFSPFGKKKEEEEKPEPVVLNTMQRMVPEELRHGRDFYFYQQIAENVPGHERDIAKQRKTVNIPFIPIANLRKFKDLIAAITTLPVIKESDLIATFEITSSIRAVDHIKYVPDNRLNGEDSDEDPPDVQIFNAWKEFQERFASLTQLEEENLFAAGAILILRKSRLGHNAIRNLVRIVDYPVLSTDLRCSILHLLRQCVNVEDDEFSDAGLLQKETLELDEADENRRIEIMQHLMSLDKEGSIRQNIIATWNNDFSLPPKLIELVSSDNKELLLATLSCANAILNEGNKKVQTTMLKWSQERADEDFFIQTRVKLMNARDQLRDRKRAIKREIPDKAKRLEQLSDDLHKRLNRRYDFSVTLQLMQVLQNMCEGHYTDMQNYMRDQFDNQISINVLESITSVLDMLAKAVDTTTFDLAVQTLATLTELVQGPCFGNQVFITSQNIGETITKIIATTYGDCTEDQLWELRMAAVTLLQSLFEGHMNTHLVSTLINSISYTSLVKLMDATYQKFMEDTGQAGGGNVLTKGFDAGKNLAKGLFMGLGVEDEFTDKLNLACNIFIFLKATLDIQALTIGRDDDKENDSFYDRDGVTVKEALRQSSCYKELSKKVATIEIARNGIVEKAYFRKPMVSVLNLKEPSKDRVIKEVDRNGDTSRLKDFFEMSFNLIREMEYYEDMSKTPGLSIIYNYSHWFDAFSLMIAFGMNIYLISVVDHENMTDVGIREGQHLDAYEGMGITIITLQCLLFLNFFFGPCRIHLNESWMEWQDAKNERAQKESKESLSIEPARVDPNAAKNLPFFARVLMSIFFIFTWYPFYQRGLFIVTAVLGFKYSPVWYCVQLFQIIEKSAQLQNVILSVTKNGKNLIMTGCLLMVVVYTFSSIAYYNYSQYFIPDMTGIGGNCDTLARCTMMMLVNGLKAGGGIGDVIDFPAFGSNNGAEGYLRLLFDFMFFLVLIVIFLNIVFGIILDTFGELRSDRDAVIDDQKGKCFICGLERSEFDRVCQGGFEQHFTFEHHMWDYLFYMHYVKLKPSDQHNGSEGFVWECMETLEPKFFPVAKAMVIHNPMDENEDDVEGEEGGAGGAGGHGKQGKKGGHREKDDDDDLGANGPSMSLGAMQGSMMAHGSADKQQIEELQQRLERIEALLTQKLSADAKK